MAGLSVSRLIRVRCALATGLRIEVRAGIPSRPGRPRGSTCQLLRAQIARMTSEASGAHAPLGDQILETGQLPFRFLPPPQHPSTLARLRPAPPLLFRRFRKGTTPFSRKERESFYSLIINRLLLIIINYLLIMKRNNGINSYLFIYITFFNSF